MDMGSTLEPAVGLPVRETTIKVSIHEENPRSLTLAQMLPPQYIPQTKHCAIKTVWFREKIVLRGISLLKIETVEQLGDLFNGMVS